MTRTLYRGLISLHPPAFRQRFTDEMLWIFDQAASTESVVPLLTDAFISLARQWVIRQGTWKVAIAVTGGLLYISIVMVALSPIP